VSLYISDNWLNRPEYNDTEVPTDPEIYKRLRDHGKNISHLSRYLSLTCPLGIDDLLAKHISHLFIRDPLVIFSELKDQDDEHSMDHFEVCCSRLPAPTSTLMKHLESTIDELANRQV